MSAIFTKLNLKQQDEVLVVNAPASFETELAALEKVTVRRTVAEIDGIEFALAFVTQQDEVNTLTPLVTN